jgi:hypothetical protein
MKREKGGKEEMKQGRKEETYYASRMRLEAASPLRIHRNM